MSSYNLIPVTDLTAVSFTGTVSTTAFTVNTATVTGEVDSNKFVTNVFPTTQPMFTFADNLGTGIFSRISNNVGGITLTAGLRVSGTTAVQWQMRESGSNGPFMWLGSNAATSTQSIGMSGTAGSFLLAQQNGNLAGGFAAVNELITVRAVGTDAHLGNGNGTVGFSLFNGITTTLLTKVSTITTEPTTLGSVWTASPDDATNIWHYWKRGLKQQATITINFPSPIRSDTHGTNLSTGITTVFCTLPISEPGLKFTFTNARAVANTVVISPGVATDQLLVFGLTKGIGASVAANAPFASLTIQCITTGRWLATKKLGTWV